MKAFTLSEKVSWGKKGKCSELAWAQGRRMFSDNLYLSLKALNKIWFIFHISGALTCFLMLPVTLAAVATPLPVIICNGFYIFHGSCSSSGWKAQPSAFKETLWLL